MFGIFYVVGKVVYNKRGGKLIGELVLVVEMLFSYMVWFVKFNLLFVLVDMLMDEIGIDIYMFILVLYENYFLLCE